MHPSRDELAGFVFGTLGEELAVHVEDHVGKCSQCEDAMRELEMAGDDVLSILRTPAMLGRYENEPDCRAMVSIAEAIGREPSVLEDQAGIEDETNGTIRDYRLLAKLGEGGMGAVYKALHTQLQKVVALKVLPAKRMNDAMAVERFRREMQAVGCLSHPNIVGAHDAGEQEGTNYLVMEYVDGVDLSKLSRRLGPLSISDACELIRQCAVGLQHAHEHGLVHRDIKPSNLMLSCPPAVPAGEGLGEGTQSILKILDLGLARLHNAPHDDLTSAGQMMGTIDYIAPEQTGDSHEVDRNQTVEDSASLHSTSQYLTSSFTGTTPSDGSHTGGGSDHTTLAPSNAIELENVVSAVDSQSQHTLDKSDPRIATRRRIFSAAIVAVLLFGAISVMRIATNKGGVIVTSDVPNIEVTIQRNGSDIDAFKLAQRPDGTSYYSGMFDVELKWETPDGITISASRFSLTRGETELVQITREEQLEADDEASQSDPSDPPSDNELASEDTPIVKQNFLHFIAAGMNVPFTASFLIFIGMLLLQITSFANGIGGDFGVDIDADAWRFPLAFVSPNIPLMVLLPPFFGAFGLVGWIFNWTASGLLGITSAWILLVSIPISAVIAVTVAQLGGSVFFHFLPPVESAGLVHENIVDRVAKVVSAKVDSKNGRITVTDARGTFFKVNCRIKEGERPAVHGEYVRIVSYDKGSDLFYTVLAKSSDVD